MFGFEASQTCAEEEVICQYTLDLTGSTTAANLADLLIGTPLVLLGLFLLGVAVRWVLHRMVNRLVSRAERDPGDPSISRNMRRFRRRIQPVTRVEVTDTTSLRDPISRARKIQRAETLGSLFKSIITGIVSAVIGTMMLSEVGVDVAPIIASAGILGIALGFGAQSLVRDFLAGIFMIVEDQFGVGDVVDTGEAIGTVEAVTLRMTRLRSLDGTVWYIPNGAIVRIGNQSQNWARALVDVDVAYGSDLAKVNQVLADESVRMWQEPAWRSLILEEPEVTGVEMLAADGISLRVLVKTVPLQQWKVARELRQRIKGRFDREGIEIPFPQRVVWHREDRAAEAGAEPA